MSQKGFAQILLLFLIFSIVGLGCAGYYLSSSGRSSIIPKLSNTPTLKSTTFPQFAQPTPTTTRVPRNTNTITVKGDANCKVQTQAALNLLRKMAPIHYITVIQYIGVIECVDQGSGMYAWESPPRYQVGKATSNAGVDWYAGTIAHDACHSKQYHDYRLKFNSASVPGDVWTGKEAERQCLDVQYDALTKIGADQNTLDYVKNIINSDYWNVNYNNRWW